MGKTHLEWIRSDMSSVTFRQIPLIRIAQLLPDKFLPLPLVRQNWFQASDPTFGD